MHRVWDSVDHTFGETKLNSQTLESCINLCCFTLGMVIRVTSHSRAMRGKPKRHPMLVNACCKNDMANMITVADFTLPFGNFKIVTCQPMCNGQWWNVHKLPYYLLARARDSSVKLQNVFQMKKDFVISHGMSTWRNAF
jgi:hypothetical protein